MILIITMYHMTMCNVLTCFNWRICLPSSKRLGIPRIKNYRLKRLLYSILSCCSTKISVLNPDDLTCHVCLLCMFVMCYIRLWKVSYVSLNRCVNLINWTAPQQTKNRNKGEKIRHIHLMNTIPNESYCCSITTGCVNE